MNAPVSREHVFDQQSLYCSSNDTTCACILCVQVDQVIDALQERKRGRMMIELTTDLMRKLLKV